MGCEFNILSDGKDKILEVKQEGLDKIITGLEPVPKAETVAEKPSEDNYESPCVLDQQCREVARIADNNGNNGNDEIKLIDANGNTVEDENLCKYNSGLILGTGQAYKIFLEKFATKVLGGDRDPSVQDI